MADALLAVPLGAVFGSVAHLSGVSNPGVLRGQFIFAHEVMLKMFMGGLAGTALSLALLGTYNREAVDKVREAKGFGDKGAVTAVLGGLIQGAGMAIAGSCPGMVFSQLGAGVPNAIVTYFGGVVGASAYAYLHPRIQSVLEEDFNLTLKDRFPTMHLDQIFFKGKFVEATLGLGLAALSVALAVEFLVPWSQDIRGVIGLPADRAIPPILAGLAIGALQIPLFFLFNALLGLSSGYSVVSSQFLRFYPEETTAPFKYAKSFVNSKSRWQLAFGFGAALGAAYFSRSIQSATSIPSSRFAHVSVLEAFIGGFFLVFGARLTGGCTSGHGLTGLPSFHVVSWFNVPAMFAGAILTGNIMASLLTTRSAYLLR